MNAPTDWRRELDIVTSRMRIAEAEVERLRKLVDLQLIPAQAEVERLRAYEAEWKKAVDDNERLREAAVQLTMRADEYRRAEEYYKAEVKQLTEYLTIARDRIKELTEG